MSYTKEQYEIDMAALNAALRSLSVYVLGGGNERLESYQQDLIGICSYWPDNHLMWEPVCKMMIDLVENDKISGLNALRYEGLLAQCVKMVKSKRVFRRKKKVSCFKPKIHRQPCFCANMINGVAKANVVLDVPIMMVSEDDLLKVAKERMRA
jgi:hypothetical protein